MLDAAQAPDGQEVALNFTIAAVDAVGNASAGVTTQGSRNVDAKAPGITNVEVFLAGIADPAKPDVTYPGVPTVPLGYATGHDGSHFIYNDSVHLKGTISDAGAGLFGSSLLYRIDGTSAQGTPQALTGAGCTDGSHSCAFDIASQALNDLAHNGAFNAASGNLKLVILAEDKAVAGDGTTAAHNITTPSTTTIAVQRLWWSRQYSAAAISGVAIHPDGDAVVTTQASPGTDTVFAQYPNGPFHTGGNGQHWSFGTALYGVAAVPPDLGSISNAPAIGQGTASTALIYVASTGGDIVAITPAGGVVWKCGSKGIGAVNSSPAIATVAALGNASACEGVFVGSTNTVEYGTCQSSASATACTTVSGAVNKGKIQNATTILGGEIYVPTDTIISQVTLAPTGAFLSVGPTFPNSGSSIGPFTGTIGAAGNLYTATSNNGSSTVYSFTNGTSTLSVTSSIKGRYRTLLQSLAERFMYQLTPSFPKSPWR